MDRLTPAQRRKNMQAVKATGSEIERALAHALRRRGYDFTQNVASVPGKPDIVFRRLKIAIFCDSEFWHGKNWSERKNDFKSRRDFWNPKSRRDRQVNQSMKHETV